MFINQKNMLNYIFHVSDIHIRNGDAKFCRYQEYHDVFDRLYDSLKKKTKTIAYDEFVIIVSGDIFHNKNNIGNYGLLLYKTLLEKLTSIGRTIIFHGNHDKNQNEVDQPSLLASTFDIPNLTILDKSTSFSIDDIGFSYVSIDDTLDTYKTCGRIATLPPFPQTEQKTKYKVALFHGTFTHVRLYNGTSVSEEHKPYPFEWIKDYDFAILGDIHLRQYGTYNDKTLWGYSGSLIQQNYGEDIINHGYMIWNIRKKQIEEVNVYNDVGLLNVKQEEGELLIRIRGKYESLVKYIETNCVMFPRNVNIKLHSNIDMIVLMKLLSQYNISYNVIGSSDVIGMSDVIGSSDVSDVGSNNDNDIHIDKHTMLKHFHKHLSQEQHTIFSEILKNNEYLLFDVSKYPEELHSECHKKNKELSVMINNCTKSDDNKIFKHPFKIKYLEWSNLYCYENKNYIDFESTYRNTFLISGSNGTGKSAIYDILVLAIWGDITTNKQNPLSAGVINHKHDNAYTIIDIISGNNVYRIKRIFSSLANKHTLSRQKIIFYKDDTVVKKDNACTEEILKITGTLEDFLASSMITQNVDYDILKMNYKDCLSMIDKAANIDYVYNLYTLFKGCMNKYRDLHKVIESKKQVYEKLMNTRIEDNQEEDIDKLKLKLEGLLCLQKELVSENNSIAINLNDASNQEILATDYEKAIRNLGEVKELTCEMKDKFNELTVLFKGYHESYIIDLVKMDYVDITDIDYVPEKPCELSFIKEQEDALKQYENYYPTPTMIEKYKSIDSVTKMCEKLKEDRNVIVAKLQEINDIKPVTVSQPDSDFVTIVKEIEKYYGSIEELQKYCQENPNMISIDTSYNLNYDLKTYHKTVKNMRIYNKKSTMLKNSICVVDKEIHDIMNSRHELTPCHKPDLEPDMEPLNLNEIRQLRDDISCGCDMDAIDIKEQIAQNEEILMQYNEKLENVFAIEKKKDEYVAELHQLRTTEEYQYDPSCKYCCARPWVCRIAELERLISQHNAIIEDFYFKNDIEHLTIFNSNEDMKHQLANLEKYELYNQWITYLEYKERYDSITSLYNEKTNEMNMLKDELSDIEKKMKNSLKIQSIFNTLSHKIHQKYIDIISYQQFAEWKALYDKTKKEKAILEDEIENITRFITYENDIRPRIVRLGELKKSYEIWKRYDDNAKIQNAKEFYHIKEIIDMFEKRKEYQENNLRKSLIIRKIDITERLSKLEKDIKEINDIIAKSEANDAYYQRNIECYQCLCESLSHIDKVLDVIEVIISKFKNYRKDIYDNYVIKNLIVKANKYIQTVCHSNTKPFTLDYIITEVKDILHINWLVRTNDENVSTKQLISVHQASGFQQFVISLALRMSLFSNKTCQQLFFDEGFTACDKQNLSIVPTFLKRLLNIFDSVIIVSHIDIIQDSTDAMTHIQYDKNTKSSSIKYGISMA